jgi:hypothetical protein
LYARLAVAGFDGPLVRALLPEWWEDDLAAVPFNRAHAEGVVASHLPFTIAQLCDPSAPLALPEPAGGVCFKRNRGKDVARCYPSLYVARRAAELVAGNLGPSVPPFAGHLSAADIRADLLQTEGQVDLANLARFCWGAGVPVVPLARFPKGATKFDGVALYRGGRPVIVLASGRDGPPWLAFDLAHELGHVMHGHVRPTGGLHVDGDMKAVTEDAEEVAADRFAFELLAGSPDGLTFPPVFGMTAPKLAAAARRFAAAYGVHPGTVCLFYGRSAGRWGAAQAALTALNAGHGGRAVLAAEMGRRLDADELPASAARFLEAVCYTPQTAVTDDAAAAVC